MAIWVQKFGGSSVGNIERIQHITRIIAQSRAQGHQVVVVVSALHGETNRLIDLAQQIPVSGVGTSAVTREREDDALLAAGEQVSAALVAMSLQAIGCAAKSYNGVQLPIQTSDQHGRACIKHIDVRHLKSCMEQNIIAVVTGFQGVASDGSITTLGRGGSDLTAVALAKALAADECQIYTDVDGIYSCDPRIVKNAYKLEQIKTAEMLEMAAAGAQVMQCEAMAYAMQHATPLRVLSSFKAGEGTHILPVIQATTSNNEKRSAGLIGMALDFEQSSCLLYSDQTTQGLVAELQMEESLQYARLDYCQRSYQSAQQALEQPLGSTARHTEHGYCIGSWAISSDALAYCLEHLRKFFSTRNHQMPHLVTRDQLAKLSLVGADLEQNAKLEQQVKAVAESTCTKIYASILKPNRLSLLVDPQHIEAFANQLHQHFFAKN